MVGMFLGESVRPIIRTLEDKKFKIVFTANSEGLTI